MRVFVTGASGYIGHAVATALARNGHRVLGLVRTKSKANALAAREVEPLVGSMDAPRAWVARAKECQVLIHCAAEYTARYMELDRQTVETLLGCVGRDGQAHTFVYTSGVWVYGDTQGATVDESSELHPPPISVLRAKTEAFVLAANQARLRTLVIRPGCVYGESGSLTASWFETAAQSGAARMVGDGHNRWAMVHLHDLADLYVRAVESGLGGEIFNAVDRSRFTVLECATAASRAAGASGKVTHQTLAEAAKSVGPMAECLAFDQSVDASKAVRMLGWQPRHGGFVDGVERYHAAWRAVSAKAK